MGRRPLDAMVVVLTTVPGIGRNGGASVARNCEGVGATSGSLCSERDVIGAPKCGQWDFGTVVLATFRGGTRIAAASFRGTAGGWESTTGGSIPCWVFSSQVPGLAVASVLERLRLARLVINKFSFACATIFATSKVTVSSCPPKAEP